MSQQKGYERFLKNANPKLEMNEYEFYTFRGNRGEHLAAVMEECETDERRLRKLGRSNLRMGFAVISFGVAIMQIFLAALQKEALFGIGYLSVAALFIFSGVITMETIRRKSKMAPADVDDLKALARAYYEFHWGLAGPSEEYSVYKHKVNMANVSDFNEIRDRIMSGV